MYIAIRVLLLIIIMPSVYYFIYWVPFSLIPIGEQYWIQNLISLITALVVGWFIWSATKHGSPNDLASSIFTGAFIIGGIGFFSGFFGPIVFAPESNQGPMLGLFITGPFGFLLGAFGGLIYWMVRGKKESNA